MTGLQKMKKTVTTVPVWMTDNPALHIVAHMEVLAAPDTLQNIAKQQAVFAHILEHMAVYRDGDPDLAGLIGNPPPPQAMVPGQDPTGGSASGKQGPSDKDMDQAQKVTAEPNAKPSMDQTDDSAGAMGRLPKPAESPAPPGA